MESETLKRYKISGSELLCKLGIAGKLSFITESDGGVIIEVLIESGEVK